MADEWERIRDTSARNGETTSAFSAFALYRDMGATRSTAKVARESGKHKSLMDRWSSRWGWVARVAAYDAYIDQQRVKANQRAILDMNDRHAAIEGCQRRGHGRGRVALHHDAVGPLVLDHRVQSLQAARRQECQRLVRRH